MPVTGRLSKIVLAATLSGVVYSTQVSALEGGWHAGLNAGVSRVAPDTDGSRFDLDNDQSTAFGAYFGLDITPVISAEVAFTDLGAATLSDNQAIAYQAVSVGAVAYVWGEKYADSRDEGPSAYLRLGLSAMKNEADIRLDKSNSTAIWLGAGMQYPLSERWGLRAELSSFDGDAQAINAGIYWRFGISDSAGSNPIDTTIEQPDQTPSEAAPVITPPSVEDAAEPTTPEQPAPQPVEPVAPQITPAQTIMAGPGCPAEALGNFTDENTCVLLNSLIADMAFEGATAELATASNAALDSIVEALQANPDSVIEIRAHVQSSGNAPFEAQLSAQRARSVARYLVQNGVPVSQLRAKAFGATQPLNSEASSSLQSNNRIELRSL